MSFFRALAAGVVGACTLTLLHESARRVIPKAPRMDVLGMRAIAQSTRRFGHEPPMDGRLHTLALMGDVVSNSLYYSLVGLGGTEAAPRNGVLLGLVAGTGGVLLPKPLGLGNAPSARTVETKTMTIGWYVIGGIGAAVAYRWLVDEPAGPLKVVPST